MLLEAYFAEIKSWKIPLHGGTHLRVLSESDLTNTKTAEFRWFSNILASLQVLWTNVVISIGRVNRVGHGLSQQGVLMPFWTPKPLKRTPQDTQTFSCVISINLNLKLIIDFFHLLKISMTLFNDIMPYFDEFIHVCC